MNADDILSLGFSRDPAPASQPLRREPNSTTPWFLSIMIFIRMPVTFLFWHTYFVVIPTLNGGSVGAARGLLEIQSKCNAHGKGVEDE
jgi:hypothetical protein